MKRTTITQRSHRCIVSLLGLTAWAGTGSLWPCVGAAFAMPVCAASPVDDQAPATVQQAASVLDLRTIELPADAKVSSVRQVGQLTYETPADPGKAFNFHRNAFVKAGWKELPGSTIDASYANGMFSKSGFTVSCSTSPNGRSGEDAASFVSLFNFGNVPLDKVPVVKGATSIFSNAASASYVTKLDVPKAADEMMELLRKDGWKFYGRNPLSDEQHFLNVRKNAIQLAVMIAKAPAQGNQTSIMVSSLILNAEIPAPDDALQLSFDGNSNTLRFQSLASFDDIGKFYSSELAMSGWKATSEKPAMADDEFGRPSALLVFRNAAKDMISVEMVRPDEQTDVTVIHQTKQQLDKAEENAREAAKDAIARRESDEADQKAASEKAKMEFEESSRETDALANALIAEALGGKAGKGKAAGKASGKSSSKSSANKHSVAIQIPAGAEVDSSAGNVMKISVAAGKGQATAKAIADSLKSAGWQLEEEEDLSENSGNLSFKGDNGSITLTYVDTGFTPVTMMLIGIGTDLTAQPAEEAPKKAASPKKKK